jgi:hypothetical protein
MAGCHRSVPSSPSFYCWKSVFNLSAFENNILKKNNCKTLYIKFADMDINEVTRQIKPIAKIKFELKPNQNIVPVIFLKNRLFQNIDSAQIKHLAENINALIKNISTENKLSIKHIQFDCDWTVSTKTNYFIFLRTYKIYCENISATIRLHQVKYPQLTGIPPVKKGLLMYYNMNQINAGKLNSIYDRPTALRYVYAIANYPLQLDLALPIFSWCILIRDKKVIEILNKTQADDFKNNTNFLPVSENKIKVNSSCFYNGYYFVKGDLIKYENVSESDLQIMCDDLKAYISRNKTQIIFYDLDSLNLKNYHENFYQEVANQFN